MLTIEILGIGCYGNPGVTFRFDLGVTLLHGVSGCGKSSIFRAIDWALYGKCIGIYKHDMTKSRVVIKLDDLTVVRERGKNKLIVLCDGTEWRGEAAQQYINSVFGSRERWISSSYVVQGEKNILFGLSKIEKSSVLSWCNGIEPTSVIKAFKTSERNKMSDHQKSRIKLDVEHDATARLGVQLTKDIIQNKDIPEHVDVILINKLLDEANNEKVRIVEIEKSLSIVNKSLNDTTIRINQYRSDLDSVMKMCGIEDLSNLGIECTRDRLMTIIRSTQIKMIKDEKLVGLYNEKLNEKLNESYNESYEDIDSNSKKYTSSELTVIDNQCRSWQIFREAKNAWKMFKKNVDVGDITMEDYVEQCKRFLKRDKLVKSLTVVNNDEDIDESITRLQNSVNDYDSLGSKPEASNDLKMFRLKYGISTDQLKLIIDHHNSLSVKVQKPLYPIFETDTSRYGIWLDLKVVKQATDALYIGKIESNIRVNAHEIHRIVMNINNVYDVKIQFGDTALSIINRFGFTGMTNVEQLEQYVTIVKDMNMHNKQIDESDIIDDNDYEFAKAVVLVEKYKELSTPRWLSVDEYNRLMQIHYIQDELKRLNVSQHDIDRFEAHLKMLPYTCEKCGYVKNIKDIKDVAVGENGAHGNHSGITNINLDQYTRWKSLQIRYNAFNVITLDIDRINKGLNTLISDNNKSRDMDKHKQEYDDANSIIVRFRNNKNSMVDEDRILTIVSKISRSSRSSRSSTAKLQHLDDLHKRSAEWLILKSTLEQNGYPLMHRSDQELNKIVDCISVLNNLRCLNEIQWNDWPNVFRYTTNEQIANDIAMSKIIDSKIHNNVVIDGNEIQRFKMYHSSRMNKNDVENMYKQSEEWNRYTSLLTSTGLTHQIVNIFNTCLDIQTVIRIVDEEDRLLVATNDWLRRRELITDNNVNNTTVHKYRKDITTLKMLKQLHDDQKCVLNAKSYDEKMMNVLMGLTIVNKPVITIDNARTINTLIDLYRSGNVDLSFTLKSVDHLNSLKSNTEKILQTFEYINSETRSFDTATIERNRLLTMMPIISEGVRTSSAQIDHIIQTLVKSIRKGTSSNLRRESMLRIRKLQSEVISSYNDTSEHMQLRTKLEGIKDCFDHDNIYRLNTEINVIMERLFNDDFKLEVTSTKESKTTGNIRHETGLSIRKGDWETSIRGVSGGQADRISLALTIALSNIWGSKFVLIDESMSSLDDETRRVCINVLRETGKICVCIAHNDIAGMYDHSLLLE